MRKPIQAQPRPVKLSEWAQHAGRPVTRGEMLNVCFILIERRFQVQAEMDREGKWYRRLGRWLAAPFVPRVEAGQLEQLAEAVRDPIPPEEEGAEPAVGDGATVAGKGEIEDDRAETEPPFKPLGDNGQVHFRDKRKGRDE